MNNTQTAIDVGALVERDRMNDRLVTNEAIFELEMEKIFKDGWVFVGHDSEVPTAGEYVRRTMGRVEVMMVRQKDGSTLVLPNRCSHRGNLLLNEKCGKTKFITCKYHGWVFDLAGNLKEVPYPGGFTKDKSTLNIADAIRTETYRGFVFATFNAAASSLMDQLGLAKDLIDRACNMSPTGRIQISAGWSKMRYFANWKVLPENAGDGYHLNYVHVSFATAMKSQYDVAALAGEESLVTHALYLGNGHTELTLGEAYTEPLQFMNCSGRYPEYVAQIKAAYGEEKGDRIVRQGPPHALVFPNLFLFEMNLVVIQPISATESIQWSTPLLLEGVSDDFNQRVIRNSEAALGASSVISCDDGVIMERQQIAIRDSTAWQDLSRGINREHVDESGVVVGHVTDEGTNRGFWQHYKKVMSAPSRTVG